MDVEGVFFNTSDYELKSTELGHGAYGTVYVAENLNDSQEYACKIINTNKSFDGKEQMLFLRESLILHKLDHPSIVKYIGINFKSFEDSSILEPAIITEYIKNGSLEDNLNKERRGLADLQWSPTKKYIALLGISDAMRYLHSLGIFHRDLKPQNILIDDDYYPRVCDFGLSKCFSESFQKNINLTMTSQIGTPLYMAPELFRGEKHYDSSIDVYAFSILAYEIVSNEKPYSELGESIFGYHLIPKVNSGHRPKRTPSITDKMWSLLCQCWSDNPSERPTFEYIFNELKSDRSYFLESVDEEEVTQYLNLLSDCNKSDEPYIPEKIVEEEVIQNFDSPSEKVVEKEAIQNLNPTSEKVECKKSVKLYFSESVVEEKITHTFDPPSEKVEPKKSAKLYFSESVVKEKITQSIDLLSEKVECKISDIEKEAKLKKLENEINELKGKIKSYKEDNEILTSTNEDFLNGVFFALGPRTVRNYKNSEWFFEQSSFAGNRYSSFILGVLYESGEEVRLDMRKSLMYYERSAKQGVPRALNRIGNCYMYGINVQKDYSKAFQYYTRAIKFNDSSAICSMGLLYINGQGVAKDTKKGFEYIQKAADMGNPEALFQMGFFYGKGQVVPKNNTKAVEYYLKAAEKNHGGALNLLGFHYIKGIGVQKDVKMAICYYQRAAEFNHVNSIVALGTLYKNGTDVKQDINKAIEYYQKAAALGDQSSIEILRTFSII